MGTIASRSWSHSRQRLFERCERAFFLRYYSKNEPDMHTAKFLGKLTNHQMLGGDRVHWAISIALRNFKRDRMVVTNLKDPAIAEFKRICESSATIAKGIRGSNNKPTMNEVLLHSDIYGYDASFQFEKGIENIATCLDNFEVSEHWDMIQKSDWRKWREIEPAQSDMPTFGLIGPHCRGVRIYAGYDLAFDYKGRTHVIDWKTGRPSNVEEQLTVYAMGLSKSSVRKVLIPDIRLQAVWLQSPGEWKPSPVNPETLARVRDKILDLIEVEAKRMTWKLDEKGILAPFADRSDYPPSPTLNKCLGCNFAMICPEGRAVVEMQAAS